MNISHSRRMLAMGGKSGEAKLIRQGELNALKVFHKAAEYVPAYKDFLKRNNIRHELVKSYNDFIQVPQTNKLNYIDHYNVNDVKWSTKNNETYVINSSSGSTGKPHFWFTSTLDFEQGAQYHELIFDQIMKIGNKKTLIIVNFGMGTWVAGIFTFLSTYIYAKRGKKPISIVTPGFNRDETIRVLLELSSQYEQIVFAGYPTFVRDIINQWMGEQKYQGDVRFLFAGEAITESWRDYILNKVSSTEKYTSAINIFGSADAAFMGFETPTTILLRKECAHRKSLNKKLFSDERVPSISAYLPTHINFEEVKNEIILTTNRTIPLIRYNIKDRGGILNRSAISSTLDFNQLISTNGLEKADVDLPMVYVFGRGIFGATIYAANIYPENIKEVLVQKQLTPYVTGRFILETRFTKEQNHYLSLTIELNKGMLPSATIQKLIQNVFCKVLVRINSEYNKIFEEYGKEVEPRIELVKYGQNAFNTTSKFRKNS